MLHHIAIIRAQDLPPLQKKVHLQMQNSPSTLLKDVLDQYTGKTVHCLKTLSTEVSNQLHAKGTSRVTSINQLDNLHLYAMIIVVVRLKEKSSLVVGSIYSVTHKSHAT